MRHIVGLGVLLAIAAAVAPQAAAQIESHCVPVELPPQLFPTWITSLPKVESQELSGPLVSDAIKSRQAAAPKAADGQGQPGATTLNDMCPEPREAIRMAEAGRFKEAAAAGDKLLAGPRGQFFDFTADYLANATAWSFIQCGDLAGAARVHLAAAARIDDAAVAEYHSRMSRWLGSPDLTAARIKDYAAYKAEVRKLIDERVEALKKAALPGQKIALDSPRLARLNEAYPLLRVIVAFDVEAGRQEIQNTFIPAAQGLVNDVVPNQIENGRKLQKTLEARLGAGVGKAEENTWNSTVVGLQVKVREIKRLCRMHDYLARMKLATAGNSDRFFGEAHQFLFVPSEPDKVWQQVGRGAAFNNTPQMDFRVKVPYQETYITPMGVPFAGRLATPMHSWKPAETPMTPANGRMTGMQPGMTPISGGMTPINGGMTPINGGMTPINGGMTPIPAAR